jgi:hypothetical protein
MGFFKTCALIATLYFLPKIANSQEPNINIWGEEPTDMKQEDPVEVTDDMVIEAVNNRATSDPSDDMVCRRTTVNQSYYDLNIPLDSLDFLYNRIVLDDGTLRTLYNDSLLTDSLVTNAIPRNDKGEPQQSTQIDQYFDSSELPTDIKYNKAKNVNARAYPNPLQGGQEQRLECDSETGAGYVVITDLSGRVVRRIDDFSYGDGKVNVTWDGKNNNGDDLPSAVYIANFRTEYKGREIPLSKTGILVVKN